MAFDMSGYLTVDERIAQFTERFPEGSFQPADPKDPFQVLSIGETTFIVYGAKAYRTPDDKRPGIGYAYEPVPGKTTFTFESELQNAETSAIGRAIKHVLGCDPHGPSAEEVRNRSGGAGEIPVAPHTASPSTGGTARPASGPSQKQINYARKLLRDHGGEWPVEVLEYFDGNIPHEDEWSRPQISFVIDTMKNTPPPPKAERRGPTSIPNADGEPVDVRDVGDTRAIDEDPMEAPF